MTENEFLLNDRIEKIKSVISKYGEENFILAFSGGKDSTVCYHLIDMALPNNKIPRVYSNTGIEFNLTLEFVKKIQLKDDRVIILEPKENIRTVLNKYGYPFKSKAHSAMVDRYNRIGLTNSTIQYLGERTDKKPWSSFKTCPQKLHYQFESKNACGFKISDKCCKILKEKPFEDYSASTGKNITITGIMRSEHGRRDNALCLSFRNNKLKYFQPLAVMSEDWEQWFIDTYNIELSPLYYAPYNFTRTGCKGCPFNRNLQKELDTLENILPNERKQCEIIWKPVYDEYRRLNYRLKGGDKQ